MAKPGNVVFEFWERFENEIYKQNRSKAEIARKCNFDRKILSNYGNISLPYFARICKELNISADYLLFGENGGKKSVAAEK